MNTPAGYVETLDATHATGWARHGEEGAALVTAVSGALTFGQARAAIARPDVDLALTPHGQAGGGFALQFTRRLTAEELDGLVLRVGGRTLEFVPALAATCRAWPVFITGSPRSGTSILALALRRAGYGGFLEGNFLSLLTRITQDVEQHFRDFGTRDWEVLTAHVQPARLVAQFATVLRDTVEPLYGGRAWFDKTGNPEMIEAIPQLQALWPGAAFIFARRRGIETVVSRLRKFPQLDFAYHCRDWARNMAAWRRLRAAHPALPVLEIDQRELITAPEAAAAALGSFLRLAPEAVHRMAQVFAEERTEETAPGTAARRLSLEDTGWSPAMQHEFRALCGAEMAAFGYDEEG